jgi:hypothetical protein
MTREIVREDLHVACKHDEIGLRLCDNRLDLRFLLHLRVFRDRQVMKRNVAHEADGERRAGMVRDYPDDVHVEFAQPVPIQEITETVIEFGDEQQDPLAFGLRP